MIADDVTLVSASTPDDAAAGRAIVICGDDPITARMVAALSDSFRIIGLGGADAAMSIESFERGLLGVGIAELALREPPAGFGGDRPYLKRKKGRP